MSAGLRPRSSDTDPPVKRSRAASSVISAHQWCVFTSLRAACNTREARASRVAHCSRLSSSRRSSATVSLRRCWSSRSIAAATGARERSLGTRGQSAGGRKVGGGRRGSPGADAIDMTSPGCLRRVADSDTAKLRRAPGRAYPNSAEETVRSSAHSKQLGRRLDPRDSLPRPPLWLLLCTRTRGRRARRVARVYNVRGATASTLQPAAAGGARASPGSSCRSV